MQRSRRAAASQAASADSLQEPVPPSAATRGRAKGLQAFGAPSAPAADAWQQQGGNAAAGGSGDEEGASGRGPEDDDADFEEEDTDDDGEDDDDDAGGGDDDEEDEDDASETAAGGQGKVRAAAPGVASRGRGGGDGARGAAAGGRSGGRKRVRKWSPAEHAKLAQLVEQFGPENRSWQRIAQLIPGRNGKQCRERWLNHLRTDIKRGGWTTSEELLLCQWHSILGPQWSKISKKLNGRTENATKNRWNGVWRSKATGASRRRNTVLTAYISRLRAGVDPTDAFVHVLQLYNGNQEQQKQQQQQQQRQQHQHQQQQTLLWQLGPQHDQAAAAASGQLPGSAPESALVQAHQPPGWKQPAVQRPREAAEGHPRHLPWQLHRQQGQQLSGPAAAAAAAPPAPMQAASAVASAVGFASPHPAPGSQPHVQHQQIQQQPLAAMQQLEQLPAQLPFGHQPIVHAGSLDARQQLLFQQFQAQQQQPLQEEGRLNGSRGHPAAPDQVPLQLQPQVLPPAQPPDLEPEGRPVDHREAGGAAQQQQQQQQQPHPGTDQQAHRHSSSSSTLHVPSPPTPRDRAATRPDARAGAFGGTTAAAAAAWAHATAGWGHPAHVSFAAHPVLPAARHMPSVAPAAAPEVPRTAAPLAGGGGGGFGSHAAGPGWGTGGAGGGTVAGGAALFTATNGFVFESPEGDPGTDVPIHPAPLSAATAGALRRVVAGAQELLDSLSHQPAASAAAWAARPRTAPGGDHHPQPWQVQELPAAPQGQAWFQHQQAPRPPGAGWWHRGHAAGHGAHFSPDAHAVIARSQSMPPLLRSEVLLQPPPQHMYHQQHQHQQAHAAWLAAPGEAGLHAQVAQAQQQQQLPLMQFLSAPPPGQWEAQIMQDLAEEEDSAGNGGPGGLP